MRRDLTQKCSDEVLDLTKFSMNICSSSRWSSSTRSR